ncbi:polysaccharide pyruvyl transferase family protein [Marisediminicola senii]|uniref:polysaccharide pyruvyl transferase family protein n=1 Tax=Marisediminicola senii TaxID=2711233 RepID=UPI0038B240BF
MKRVKVFVVLTGQRDNLGDSLLRRPLLSVAKRVGECHVLVGPNSSQYSDNLGLDAGDYVYTSRIQWLGSLLRSTLVRKTHLFFNAGEFTLNRAFVRDRVAMLPIVALVRARGGSVIQAGAGLRNTDEPISRALRWLARSADVTAWRDERSRDAMATGDVMPDWAFSEGSTTHSIRERSGENLYPAQIVFSLRGDREQPSDEWITRARRLIDSLDAVPLVVCQVQRDRDRLVWLATALGADYDDWSPEVGHASRERQVRAVYGRSSWVVSDRLHVLVAAMTEGSVPIALAPDSSRKLSRTLEAAGFTYSIPVEGVSQRSPEVSQCLAEDLQLARDRVNRVRESILKSCNGVSGAS